MERLDHARNVGDGVTPVAEIAAALADTFGIAVPPTREGVLDAIDRLHDDMTRHEIASITWRNRYDTERLTVRRERERIAGALIALTPTTLDATPDVDAALLHLRQEHAQ